MKKTTLFLLLGMLFLASFAQNTNDELLKKLVKKDILTQAEADSLSIKDTGEQKGLLNKVNDLFPNTPYARLGGYSLFWHRYNDTKEVKHDASTRVIFFSLAGELNKNVSYFILADMVNPLVYELYADFKVNNALKFRVGQSKIPFALENAISLTNLETALNTRSVSSLVGMSDDVQLLQNGRNNTGRDVGIQAMGSLDVAGKKDFFQYGLGIFQGSGIISSEKDNSKDFSSMLLLQPAKGFRIGGGAYFGEATYRKGTEEKASNHVRNRWVASTDFVSDRFYARAEWLHGNDGGTKKEGLYGMGQYYVVPQKLNLMAKVDYFNQDKSIDSSVMDYTAGFNYYFYKQCRVAFNYTHSAYSKYWGSKNSNQLITQLQVVF